MSSPFISVIVPTRNRAALLERLLRSLASLRYPTWEVIVVDDGSTDDTAVVVERFRRGGLPVTYLYQPWGRMGAARNLGLGHARGEIAAFTDDDCVVDPGWLDAIAAAFATSDASGVQGKTITERASMTPFTRQVEQLEGGPPYRTCNIAYRTGVLRQLGGFDPILIRGEDVVMAMRVLERGRIAFAPDALVVHPPRPKEWADRKAWRTLIESELHFRRRYARYAPSRSPTLSIQKADHVVSRWLLLPVRRYWRWHYAYLRRNPGDYLRHVPLMVREKLALLSLLPYFFDEWRALPPRHALPPSRSRQGSEEEAPHVTVVVPTRNRAGLLPQLLAALERQDYPDYDVVVVDDASSDGTPSVLACWAGQGRTALRLDTSSGSYAARNAGWRAGRGEVVAFTDDDCLPQEGWLSALVEALREDAAGVQGLTVTDRRDVTPFTHQIEQRRPGVPYRTCNIAYRRSVLERLGGFDDRLRWYADNILGFRARQIGPIAFAPNAVVRHPPRPRHWRDRRTWLERMRADALHRRALQRLGAEPAVVPGRALPLLLWVARPLLKQSLRHLHYALRHPVRYARGIRPMAREKWELLLAMRELWGQKGGIGRQPAAMPPLPERPLVSVVVVTRDRPELLDALLTALGGQIWQPRETVVVDHGETDRTQAVSTMFGARYVAASGLTLGAARQRGVDEAKGDVLAFTDDDCLPDPRWLESLVASLRAHPAAVGVQGRTEAGPGPVGSHTVRVSRPNALYQTCNIAYRRAALELAGGFDTRFHGWFEDTALAARALEHGPILFEPGALVIHRSMPRSVHTPRTWRLLLEDERLLARAYPSFYRRVRGPDVRLVILARWLIGSPLKALLRDLPRAHRDPGRYLSLLRLLARERLALLAVLLRFGGHGGSSIIDDVGCGLLGANQ